MVLPTVTAAPTSALAFWSLVAFTTILLLSPQIWFPILGSLRIAFLAAGLAIGAHLVHRLTQQEAAAPFFPEDRDRDGAGGLVGIDASAVVLARRKHGPCSPTIT